MTGFTFFKSFIYLFVCYCYYLTNLGWAQPLFTLIKNTCYLLGHRPYIRRLGTCSFVQQCRKQPHLSRVTNFILFLLFIFIFFITRLTLQVIWWYIFIFCSIYCAEQLDLAKGRLQKLNFPWDDFGLYTQNQNVELGEPKEHIMKGLYIYIYIWN